MIEAIKPPVHRAWEMAARESVPAFIWVIFLLILTIIALGFFSPLTESMEKTESRILDAALHAASILQLDEDKGEHLGEGTGIYLIS